MKLTEARLKELILEVLEDESPLEGMIKSGEWENINQALSLTVDVGLPLEELPWELLPMSIMKDDDLVELARYLMELKGFEGGGTGGQVGRMLRHGIKGMVGKFPRIGRQYVVMAVKKILGLSVLRETMDDGANMAKNIASAMGDGSEENMENALFLAELVDEDMTELGRYLSKDAAFYLYNRASDYRASHPEWLPWLITSQDPRMLKWVLQAWYKHKDRLTDEHLIKMYNSAPRAHKEFMSKYTSLPPTVKKVIEADRGMQRSGRSRLRRLRRKK